MPTITKLSWGAEDKEQLPDAVLEGLDGLATTRLLRIANHAPAFASLSYFGLISMTMQSLSVPAMASSFKAALLNLLDHFGGSLFAFKPSAIVSYSAGQGGGTRAAHALLHTSPAARAYQ